MKLKTTPHGLKSLVGDIEKSQIKATTHVNSEMLQFYWSL